MDRKGFPIYNPSGKYMVRLKFNGIERRILVDDRLPLSRDGRLMCSHSSHKEELWVSIIEKAYLKVNGGYDFPGSNSGIDMHSLTGWIPEQFGTRDEGFNPERLWERLESASKFGDCLVTVATDEMSDAEADAVGLVSAHAYAVLQVRSVSGLRLLQLKNPWSKTRWQGAYSVHDTVRWTAALRSAVEYDLTAAMQSDNGIFWIDYPSLLRYYQGVYINWNPQLFRHHTSIHAQWCAAASARRALRAHTYMLSTRAHCMHECASFVHAVRARTETTTLIALASSTSTLWLAITLVHATMVFGLRTLYTTWLGAHEWTCPYRYLR
uniref:Calpain catalytic domain-containing protein n=1 Tax=Chrysotila carterae TaxID=13221 RepID=A0A6S9ZA69_CHRCT